MHKQVEGFEVTSVELLLDCSGCKSAKIKRRRNRTERTIFV